MAPFYDRFTAAHNHDAWLAAILDLAAEHGFAGTRVLDVACGTGNSLTPLLERGYDVAGCDLSPQMLAIARTKAGAQVPLFQADLRDLPATGPYELVLCLGDVFNYLLQTDELEVALRSIAGNMAPLGLCVFDVNTLGAYATVFAEDRVVAEDADRLLLWRGCANSDARSGRRVEVIVEAFAREGELWRRVRSAHVHRAHADEEVRGAIDAAGLTCEAVYGVTPDGRLHSRLDEDKHTKRLYVAALAMQASKKGGEGASDSEARVADRPGGFVQQGQLAAEGPPGAGSPGGPGAPIRLLSRDL